MRFLLFDRVISVEPGRRNTTVKTFSMQDEHLNGHFPRRALVPGTMVLEAMLQSLGWLVMRTHEFEVLPFFSMLEDLVVPAELRPGVRLEITGDLLSTNAKGSMGRAEATVDGVVTASIGRVIYGHHRAAHPEEARRRFACYGDLA